MRFATIALAVALVGPGWAANHAPPKFTKKPTVEKTSAGVKVSFAVDRETDVTVTIEDASGKIVRRLVSGVLGKNPPPPLKANSLEQSVEWDGKADWGKKAPAGPFKVRVALGLGAKYDKVVESDPAAIGLIMNIAAGPDGTLYAVVNVGAGVPNWSALNLVALNRDGTYQRTLIPPPSNATKEQISALGGVPVEVDGRIVPVPTHVQNRQNTAFSLNGVNHVRDAMTVTPAGQVLVVHPNVRIGMVDLTGSKTPAPFLGPSLLPAFPKASFVSADATRHADIVSSSDGKHAFIHGMARDYGWQSRPAEPFYAVYRVKLPERSPAEPFFGDSDKSGNDESHLGTRLGGMATDGKGALLVCDPKNNRVVAVSEADGKFLAAFPAEGAQFVSIDKQTGAVYLLKIKANSAEVVKLSGWKNPQQVASVQLTAPANYLTWRLAVDSSAKPAVLWVTNGRELYRFEDQGAKFGEAKQVMPKVGGAGFLAIYYDTIGDGAFTALTVDHFREDPEVYWRHARFNEKTGKTERIRGLQTFSGASGLTIQPGPEGNLHGLGWPQFLYKYDRTGNPLAFDMPYKVPEGLKPYTEPAKVKNAIFASVCMTYMTHTLGIRADGHFFVFEKQPLAPERASKALYEYDGSGKRVGGPILWKVSDTVVGPKFDQAGNIYVADVVRPLDRLVAPEFTSVLGPVTTRSRWHGGDPRSAITYSYGSILKFSPKGGMIHYPETAGLEKNPFPGQPKLDPALKTMDVAYVARHDEITFTRAKVTGAEWMHFGFSHIEYPYGVGCNCETSRFDVDPYGRVWYPDLGRYRVGVLDTNGNEIITFGSYGNADSCGPESKDKKLATPEIAFSWLIGVGATDKHAYMGDSLNRRLLRAKLIYAAEEICAVP